MAQKIIGAQRDFSFGEIDVTLKRNDDHPARKAGLRQMSNMRILNSGAAQMRSGRSALFPAVASARIEKVTMSPGNDFKIAFGESGGAGQIAIYNPSDVLVATFASQGSGLPLPWGLATVKSIVYAQLRLSIYICFGHAMRPQVLTWDGITTWSIADYTELTVGQQKRTPFYRISPQNISIGPSAQTGAITIGAFGGAPFVPAHVGTRIRFVGRQILITGYTSSILVSGTVEESLPGAQLISFAVDPSTTFAVGDVVVGSVSGAQGLINIIDIPGKFIQVQLLSTTTTTQTDIFRQTNTFAFLIDDIAAGPGGSLDVTGVSVITGPTNVTVWDEEVMNDYRGYPASVFVDQFRLGFCDFKSVPGGISWSAINSPTDLYVGVNPSNAIFEVAPDKVQIYHVVPGAESSEFVFCDRKLYYIKIDPQNPLKPGSVGFQVLSSDGCAQVQPRASQEALLYVNAGGSSVMAIIASGAYYRPFNTRSLTEFHSHLFNDIQAIAVPTADGSFEERYAYALNADGSLIVGKYSLKDGQFAPTIGWGPWSGVGDVQWVASNAADVLFTTTYFSATICEALDDTVYLDASLFVNDLPASFTPAPGKGPLWWIPSQSVSLMDQGTRSMGVYQIDADGFIVPQGNAGENLLAASLVAGQAWTSTVEPFCPNAQPGADANQRMKMRQVSYFAAYVIHSTGFMMGYLFSGKLTPTSPALGTLMNFRRFPAWNQGDDPTLPPPERETVEEYPAQGSTFDPRVVLIKDTPGPLQLLELAIEVSI